MYETSADTPLAPRDTAKTAMISHRRSRRSVPDRESSDGTWERAPSGEECVEVPVLRAADQRLDLGPRVNQRRAVRVRGVPHRDLPVGQLRELHAGVRRPAGAAPADGQPPVELAQF